MSTPNDAEMSLNGITHPSNKVESTLCPTSFISDIEFASTKTNRRRYIVINKQINKCKLYHYKIVISIYYFLTSICCVSQIPLQDDCPGREIKKNL